ncbi:MAG: type 1 glutamine amidotransferase [Planctomycetota bacterium]|nr:type 1 glutamine amidotransferase [Planctomycetota bacterium]
MNIVVLQHSDLGRPGRLGATLRDHGFRLDIRRPDLHPPGSPRGVPGDLDNVHGLVLLGGPQNVTDIANYPWMQAEAALIRRAHERAVPLIGICLGAQLIAHALGGVVAPREKPALGMYPLSISTAGQTDVLLAGIAWSSPQFFTCGQEVRTPPAGATLLASARGTPHAMFRVGLRTFASLAHFECDRPMLDAFLASGRGMLPGAGITESEVRVQLDQEYEAYARLSDRLCVNLATYLFPASIRLTA